MFGQWTMRRRRRRWRMREWTVSRPTGLDGCVRNFNSGKCCSLFWQLGFHKVRAAQPIRPGDFIAAHGAQGGSSFVLREQHLRTPNQPVDYKAVMLVKGF